MWPVKVRSSSPDARSQTIIEYSELHDRATLVAKNSDRAGAYIAVSIERMQQARPEALSMPLVTIYAQLEGGP